MKQSTSPLGPLPRAPVYKSRAFGKAREVTFYDVGLLAPHKITCNICEGYMRRGCALKIPGKRHVWICMRCLRKMGDAADLLLPAVPQQVRTEEEGIESRVKRVLELQGAPKGDPRGVSGQGEIS